MKKTLLIILTTLAAPLTIAAAASASQALDEAGLWINMKNRIERILNATEEHKNKYKADVFIEDLNNAKKAASRKEAGIILTNLKKKLNTDHNGGVPGELIGFEKSTLIRIPDGKIAYLRGGLFRLESLILTPLSAVTYIISGQEPAGGKYGVSARN
jgi:hypothetical protein